MSGHFSRKWALCSYALLFRSMSLDIHYPSTYHYPRANITRSGGKEKKTERETPWHSSRKGLSSQSHQKKTYLNVPIENHLPSSVQPLSPHSPPLPVRSITTPFMERPSATLGIPRLRRLGSGQSPMGTVKRARGRREDSLLGVLSGRQGCRGWRCLCATNGKGMKR